MANRFRLADVLQVTTVDLRDGTLKLVDRSWQTSSPTPDIDYVDLPYGAQSKFSHFERHLDACSLHGFDTVANLIAGANAIEDALEGARLFHDDPLNPTSWWLEANADTESVRRSLLYGGVLNYVTGVGISPLLECEQMLARLSMYRHPLWETISFTSISDSGLSTIGGMWTINNVLGVPPARMGVVEVEKGTAGSLYRVWMGIRDEYISLTNFNPLWECEDGTNESGDCADVGGDATASNNTKVVCDFSVTEAHVIRMSITVADIDAVNDIDFVGRYLILCRCKVTAGTVALQLKSGYSDTAAFAPNEIIYITNTDWRLIELGEVLMPPEGYWASYAPRLDNFELQIFAERVVGAGNLELDCLILIPSRHYVDVVGTDIVTGNHETRIFTHENEEMAALNFSGSNPDTSPELSDRDWYLPVGTSALIIAAERETIQVLGDTVTVRMSYVPRWYSYRDA